MDVENFRDCCLRKTGATESTPFGEEHLVFKVGNKMFALLAFEEVPATANLKCDPDRALELRDHYEDVRPGYHMNKKHWNTVIIDGAIPQPELELMIDESYELVFRSLSRAERGRIAGSAA
ncbi:MAG: MmcQ/YjbR family DNA-binding protein [Chthoniobacterales bacterium]|nr:MmcQ/YjbR family DNA-binding protein [Chthoniobacterales bacterium]